MVWEHELTVRLHQQDEDDYCAAACAQMIYNYTNKILEDQSILYENGTQKNNPARWGRFDDPNEPDLKGIDPTGLTYILNTLYGNSHGLLNPFSGPYSPFSVVDSAVPYTLCESITKNLTSFHVPIPVLVYDAAHWILVRGVMLSSDPNTTTSPAIIEGFYINNPWPPCRCNVPQGYTVAPPHAETDACGCNLMPNYGISNEFVKLNFWLSTYLKTTSYPGTNGPQAVAIMFNPPIIKLSRKVKMTRQFIPIYLVKVAPDEIKESVIKEIKEMGFDSKEGIVEALDGAVPGEPTLVQRLDMPGIYYYLAPIKRQKSITAMAIMDAGEGKLDGFTVYQKPIKKFLMSRKEVTKKISGQIVDLGENRGKLVFLEGTFDVSPTMVWKPCRESLSPYYPFHVATIGDKHVYIGYDGTVYPVLHDNKRFG